MIIVAGTVDLDPEHREPALRAAAALFEATRAQPGCLAYVWSADPAEAGRVHVYERWADADALAAHLAGPCYRDMLAALTRHGLRGADVAKYHVDRSGAIYDAQGRARADFFED